MRRAVLLFVAACGRIGFDAPGATDAATEPAIDAAAVAQPKVVQAPTTMGTGPTMTVPLTPTRASSLVVVAMVSSNIGGVVPTTTSMTDDAGTTYVSANSRALWNGMQGAVEIWYAPSVPAGATTLTIASAASTTRYVWILELTNMDPSTPLDGVTTISDSAPSAMPTGAAGTPTRGPAVIVSAIIISGFVTQVRAGNPFIGLPVIDGDAAAYLITDQVGTYAAVWDAAGSGIFSSSTVVFRGLPAD